VLSLACRDVGVMDSYYVSRGETEEELWRDGTENLIKVHGMKADDITLQLKEP
jgi:hypothetical protein